MSLFWETIIRTIIAFSLIMVFTRLLGKHTIARMTYHDFVASITLGAITSNIALNTHLKTWQSVASFTTFAGIAYLVALISLKSRKSRKWLAGKPTVIIENGKILENNLKKMHVSLDALNQELREKDIFDPDEVEYAVLELNGKLSILRKPECRYVMRKDLQSLFLTSQTKLQFPVELIMDGKIITENLLQNGMSPEWMTKQLQKRGVNLEEVSYAVRKTNGDLFFDLYRDRIRHPIDQE
ncbi:DUF421 domain-containing protein [Paenibacillus allorhizosphaerae]|uniref:DUF421 domain-containing protein n=1 Tax=Paenibacillus allorhizosphaerae TaxID=2849866 RepID=A0ABM8VAZ6_9BACL|nr:DUF421 domain-containing protein [Paenibacillus allorhizosphaerae]CAG7617902.1 hypothetical protein PAECIP111802_00464 [Paenibacillus allorhizosphaerae]